MATGAYPTTNEDFSGSNVYVSQALTNFAIALGSNMGKFIADRIFPVIQVPDKSGSYMIFGEENYVSEDDTQGDYDLPKSVKRTFRSDTFVCARHAHDTEIADSVRKAADDATSRALEDTAQVAFLKEKVLLNKEYAVKTLLATSGSYHTNHYENMDTAANRNFDDAAGIGARKLIEEFKNRIADASGEDPNVAVVSGDMWSSLRGDSSFFGSGAVKVTMTEEEIAQLLGLDELIVVRSQGSTAKPKSDGSVSRSAIWPSNSLFLLHRSPPAINLPSTGKLFMYDGTEMYNQGELVRTGRYERKGDGVTWFEYKQFYVPKLTCLNTSSKIISGAWMQNCYDAI